MSDPDVEMAAPDLGELHFDRPVLSAQDILDYDAELTKTVPLGIRMKQACCPGGRRCFVRGLNFFKSVFPFVDTLMHYKWRADLLSDITAGLTVGVMNVPQGMAYALLAGLPPVYGLYVSFTAPLLYAFLGRCPQLSMGTFAVVSLLLSEPIHRLCNELRPNINNTIVTDPQLGQTECPTDSQADIRPVVAMTLTFLIGIVQAIIGLLRIGSLMVYMAPAMVDGFVTGAAFHVLTSQLASLFGIKEAKKGDGAGSLFVVYVNLFRYITRTNMITFAISALSIVFLLFVKIVAEPALKRFANFHYPLPSELALVIIGTVASSMLDLKANYNVTIVGSISSGMPSVSVPEWSYMSRMLTDSLIVGITCTCLTISLVKIFVMKYHQQIDYNYELTAFGVITIISSFFSSFAPAGSVSRSLVCEGAGARTTLNGIFSSMLVVFVLLYLGPYFSVTPTCVLSAIIAVALKNVLMHVTLIPKMWRQYKRDFLLFTVTFLVTLVLDVTLGLVVGILGCLLALSEPQRKFHLRVMRRIPGTELFVNRDRQLKTGRQTTGTATEPFEEIKDAPILTCRLAGSLNFASVENFCHYVEQLIEKELNRPDEFEQPPPEVTDRKTNGCYPFCKSTSQDVKNNVSGDPNTDDEVEITSNGTFYRKLTHHTTKGYPQSYLILDLTGLALIDPHGVTVLANMHKKCYESETYVVYVGDIKRHACLDTSLWPVKRDLPLSYLSLHDAFAACHQQYKRNQVITAL